MDAFESTPFWPDTPEEFCAALKAARERRGLTLAEISQQTKVTEAHFVALERADLRHWPKGIFRRAFFSNYVRAVGLPVEPTVAAFHDDGSHLRRRRAELQQLQQAQFLQIGHLGY